MRVLLLLLLLLAALWAMPAGAQEGLYADPLLVLEPGMHTAAVRQIDADAAGRYVVTASDDKTVRVWAAGHGTPLRTLRLPAGPEDVGKAYAAAISPDGTLVAAGGFTGTPEGGFSVYLFDRASGRLLRRAGGLPDVVLHLAFSPDGTRLAAALGGSNGVRLIDPATGRVAAEDRDYGDASYGAAFDRAGRLATTSFDGKVRLYGPGLRLLQVMPAPGGKRPYGVAFSPDGARLAVGYQDTIAVDVLDAATLGRLFAVDTNGINNGNLFSVTWLADGAILLAAGEWRVNGQVHGRIWLDSGRSVYTDILLGRSTLTTFRQLSDGRVAFASADSQLGILDSKGQIIWNWQPAIANFRDQETLLAVSMDGSQISFDYEQKGQAPALFALQERRLTLGEATPNLSTARTTAFGVTVEGWRNTSGPTLNGRQLMLEAYEQSLSLAFAPDGERFVLGTERSLRLFGRDGRQHWRRAVPGAAWAVNVTGDGRLLVAAYGDGTIRWHRLSDGEELLSLYPHTDRKRWVLWTPLGYYYAPLGAQDLIGWQLDRGWDEPPGYYAASLLRNRFRRADVVTTVLQQLDVHVAVARADEAVRQRAERMGLAALLPPVVTISQPDDGAVITNNVARLHYTIGALPGTHIDNVHVQLNGQNVIIQPGYDIPVDGLVQKWVDVSLKEKNNELRIIVEGDDISSAPAIIRLKMAEPTNINSKPTLHLIGIGISNYKYSERMSLKFAAKDAADITNRFLREEGGLYAAVKPVLLPEDEADRGSILRTFRDVQRAIRPGDLVIVFLSGHGASEGGAYYYLPYDADVDTAAGIEETGISHLELRRAFRRFFEAEAKVIAFVDTCYSGDVVEGGKALPPDVDIVAQELAQAENGVVVLTSSTGRELSKERDDLQNGIFTSALLEALKGEADKEGNRDGYVSLAELRGYLHDRVAQLSGNHQHPTARVPFEKDWEAPIAVVR